MIDSTFSWLVATTLDVSLLIAAVWLIQATMARWLSPRFTYALWCLVVVRLVLIDVPSLPGGGLADTASDSTMGRRSALNHTGLIGSGFDSGSSNTPRRDSVVPQINTPPVIASEPARAATRSGSRPIALDPDADPPVATSSAATVSPRKSKPIVAATSGVAATRQAEDTATSLSWTAVLMVTWMLGALAIIAMMIGREFTFRRRLQHQRSPASKRVVDLVGAGCRTLGISHTVDVAISSLIASPAISGVRRPVLILPPEAEAFCDADQRNIVLHELAHVKRHDVAANWIFLLIGAIHWFNPLVRLSLTKLGEARETLRDFDALAAQPGTDPMRYAQTILELVTRTHTRRDPSPVVGFLRSGGEAKRRILMIRSFDRASGYRSGLIGLAVLVVLGWASLTRADRTVAETSPVAKDRTIVVERQDAVPTWRSSLEQKLAQTHIEVHFDDMSMVDLVAFVQGVTGVNFVMTDNVHEYSAPNISSKSISVLQILRRAFATSDLEYSLYNGAVFVGERGDVLHHYDLRLYNVADLVDLEEPEQGENLAELVTQVVGMHTEAWDRDDAQIRYWRGLLCVTQTDQLHDDVHRFLNMLLRKGADAAPMPSWRLEIEKKFAQKTNIEFDDLPLGEALGFLSQIAGLNIVLDQEFEEDSISLKLGDVTVGQALQWICTLRHLRTTFDEGIIFLSVRARTEVRVYDVADVLPVVRPSKDGSHLTIDIDIENENRDQLANLISETIRPESWHESYCEVHFFGESLVIVQTEAVHSEIEAFLASMRRALR